MDDTSRPSIRSSDGERLGITEGRGDEFMTANELLARLGGRQLIQFRMGYGLHLELGSSHEVTIETALTIVAGGDRWTGEPLTADAAGALLPLNLREVKSATIARNGTLSLVIGEATLSVPPHPMYEAWQVRGPSGLLIVCAPGGEYVAVWEAEGS